MEKFTIVYLTTTHYGSNHFTSTNFYTFDVRTLKLTKEEIGAQIHSMLDHVDNFFGEVVAVFKGAPLVFEDYGIH